MCAFWLLKKLSIIWDMCWVIWTYYFIFFIITQNPGAPKNMFVQQSILNWRLLKINSALKLLFHTEYTIIEYFCKHCYTNMDHYAYCWWSQYGTVCTVKWGKMEHFRTFRPCVSKTTSRKKSPKISKFALPIGLQIPLVTGV